MEALPLGTAVDGELVAFDESGRPSFNAIQNASADPTWAPGLTAAYKQHWRPVLSDFQIERALALTQPLAIASYLYGRDPSFTSEYRHDARHQSYARSLARHMDRVVQAQEFRRALCN